MKKSLRIISSIFFILFCIFLFIMALLLMKEGAKPLAPIFRNHISIDSPANALGFGWLTASMVLSGSPIAATSLALLDAHVLLPLESYAMIVGSRLGASFIVLLIGYIYILRGKKREVSLGVGLVSLLVTQTIYLPVMFIGFFLLSLNSLKKWQLLADQSVNSPFEIFFSPFIQFIEQWFPAWILFPLGFVLMFVSLWLFDRAIPDLHLGESKLRGVNRLLYRPMITFLLGAGITAITMSVSVSLSLLVPLSVRGYIRRENIIPYILGANITTFIDTLIAAALLVNPAGVTVVLVQIISVAIVSLIILLTSYKFYVKTIEWLVNLIGQSHRNIFIYISIILGVPILLLIIS